MKTLRQHLVEEVWGWGNGAHQMAKAAQAMLQFDPRPLVARAEARGWCKTDPGKITAHYSNHIYDAKARAQSNRKRLSRKAL